MELMVLHGDREEKVGVRRTDGGYEVRVGDRTYRVDSRVSRHAGEGARGAGAGAHLLSLRIDGGRHHEVAVHRERSSEATVYLVAPGAISTRVEVMDPLTHLARETRGDKGRAGVEQVTAYMPGRVVEVLVEEGAEVEEGEGVVVLEAMKMENEIQAGGPGTVRHIFVQPGQAVEGGDPLFEIE
jgi:biotin carboxyl carrier protein